MGRIRLTDMAAAVRDCRQMLLPLLLLLEKSAAKLRGVCTGAALPRSPSRLNHRT
jgi:hypothetical protein